MSGTCGRMVTLGEIADLGSGGTPSRAVPAFFAGTISWVKTLDLTNGLVHATDEQITDEALRSFRGQVFPVGTVLVAMYGGAGTIGKSGLLATPCAINQALCAMPPRPDEWDAGYLHFWLQSVRPQWMGFAAGNRKDPNINKQVVSGMKLFLPPLDVQRRIRDGLDAAMTAAQTAVAAVEDQAKLAGRMVSTLLGESFPAAPIGAHASAKASLGWAAHRLTDLALLESGHTPSRRRPEWWGGDVPWLALPDIRKLHGKFAYETTENTNDAGLKNSSARLLPVGTVCVSRTASIGFVTMLGKPMATSQDFCNWVCDPQTLDAEFLMYAFMASQQHLRELGSGAVHKTIYMPTIQSFHLCAPALAEQRRIASRLRDSLAAAEALSTHLRERQAEIAQLPRRLLAAAFEPVA